MKQIIYSIVFVLFIGKTFNSGAQSLDSLINLALESNYQIQILKNQVNIAANNNTWGIAGRLPSIDIGAGVTSDFSSSKLRFSDGTERVGSFANNTNINASILANWTIFDGFRVQATKERLNYLEQIGQEDVKFFVEQTVSDIVAAYYQLVYEQQLLKNFQESLDISALRLQIEAKRREVGAAKGIDYGMALVDYQLDSIRLLAQINTIESIEIELNRVLNTDLEKRYLLDSIFDIEILPSKDSLLSIIKTNNKQLQLERLRELLAETEVRIAKADRYPRVNIFAGYEYTQSFSELGFVESSRNLGPAFGINISYNLFNGGATKKNVANTALLVESANLSKEDVNLTLDATVLNLYKQYASLQSRIALATQNIQVMESIYISAEEQLKRGAINGLDFRAIQLNLLNTELSLIQLQFLLKAAEININRLSGNIVQAYIQ
jgi:outer membrane protein TolC